MKTKTTKIIEKIECCEECFKWGRKYGEYKYPCLNTNCKCHRMVKRIVQMVWEELRPEKMNVKDFLNNDKMRHRAEGWNYCIKDIEQKAKELGVEV